MGQKNRITLNFKTYQENQNFSIFESKFTVEPEQKAMIVISHPWEFVPKGSSHLNYHTNSSTTNQNNKTDKNENKMIINNANSNPNFSSSQSKQHQQNEKSTS